MKEEHTRRFSLETDFMNKEVDDILYGMMQSLSTYSPVEHKLYLLKTIYNKSKNLFLSIDEIAATKEPSRTLRRHLVKLIKQGIVKEDTVIIGNKRCECYIFPYDMRGKYYIINTGVLNYVTDTKSISALQIFIYLAFEYELTEKLIRENKRKDKYSFTKKELVQIIGYSANSKLIMRKIDNILFDLKRTGLIDYQEYVENIPDVNIPIPRMRLIKVAQKVEDFKG